MRTSSILATGVAMLALSLPACHKHEGGHHHEQNKVVLTSPLAKDVTITQQYVCQIRAKRFIEVRALEEGYLEEIHLKEGQTVKQDDVMFRVVPTLYKARLDAELAEVQFAKLELDFSKDLAARTPPVVSQSDVALQQAKLTRARAKAAQAETELNFTIVKAPFDGIVDRLKQQQGSLVEKKEVLTTLSDNSVMWVYHNVPEARYLEYMATPPEEREKQQIELILANGMKYPYPGKFATIEGTFNNETGNIPFRVDFPNPDRVLRHGQTGTVSIRRLMKNAVVIPQRATFEILDKQYVWVVGDDRVVRQRPITVAHELEDIYVIKSGLDLKDKIVLEGVQQVHDNDKLEDAEFEKPGEALAHQKHPAQ